MSIICSILLHCRTKAAVTLWYHVVLKPMMCVCIYSHTRQCANYFDHRLSLCLLLSNAYFFLFLLSALGIRILSIKLIKLSTSKCKYNQLVHFVHDQRCHLKRHICKKTRIEYLLVDGCLINGIKVCCSEDYFVS